MTKLVNKEVAYQKPTLNNMHREAAFEGIKIVFNINLRISI